MRTIAVATALLAALSASADPSLDDALALLRITEPRDAKLARWTAGGKNLWVVAAVEYDVLETALLRERGGELEVVARAEGVEPLANEPLWTVFVTLDLIPYRISDRETAFGVRVSNSYHSTARSSGTEALHLFRWRGDALAMVFADLTMESEYEIRQDVNGEGPEDEGTTSRWVVIVSKTKHRGFYDLLVREKSTKKTERWRWNGTAYAK